MVTKESNKKRSIRLPETMDKEIYTFSISHFKRDYSKALRFLVQLGLIAQERMDTEILNDIVNKMSDKY